MDDALRRSAAHVRVADVSAPALDEGTAHHLGVLRLRPGETVTVTDLAGSWRACRLGTSALDPTGDVVIEPAPDRPVTVAVAMPKGERAEWLVQKCTEVGVDRIVVLTAERSVVRWTGERAERHVARLERVAVEAALQSRRVRVSVIDGPVEARSLLPDASAAEPGGRSLSVNDTCVAVGPEGGWTEAELELAADRISLGPSVLRVETAAVVAAALMVANR